MTTNTLSISSQFDSGAIEVVRLDAPHDIQLRIRRDTAADFAQWFHFCLHGAAGQSVTLRFMNASECAYPKGWEGYQVVSSEDRQHWSRIETSYDGQVLTARVTPQTNTIYFATSNRTPTSNIWTCWPRPQRRTGSRCSAWAPPCKGAT